MIKKIYIAILTTIFFVSCTDQGILETPITDKGALVGKFSVSPSKQVQFSQGNLQHNVNSNTWRFAEYQFEVINRLSQDQAYKDGWRDLFCWEYNKNLDYPQFNEWGVNSIINGGNQSNQWFTLSTTEWVYLFHERKKAGELFGFGRINGINGMILLPDDWVTPKHITFHSGSTTNLVWGNKSYTWNESIIYSCYYDNISKNKGDIYSSNVYNATDWGLMEKKGAVFLPAAGNFLSENNSGQPIGGCGDYWSSSSAFDYYYDYAYCLTFFQNGLFLTGRANIDYGFSVRLVK